MVRLSYIVLILASILAACSGNHSSGKELVTAERLIAINPDSAISILAGMDTSRMSDRQKDRRILLYAYVSIIHGGKIALDSVGIAEGDEAFGSTLDSDEVKWLIVKSAEAGRRGNAVARIELLKDAEFLALRQNDKFDLANIYLLLAGVYEQGFNGTVSKHYADKALAIFKELKSTLKIRDAKMAIVGAFAAQRDYRSMLDSLLAMKPEVMANATDSYKTFFLDQLARSYDADGQTRKAIEIWQSIYTDDCISANTLAHWAHAYYHIGKLDSAYMLIQRAVALPHGNTDEYLCRNVEHDILKKMGRTRELARTDSLREVASYDLMADRQLEESSLALNMKYDSAAREARLEAAEAQNRSKTAVFIAILALILAAAVYIFLRKRNQMLRLEHENDVLRIQALQDNLFASDSRNKATSAKISDLFHSRFNLLDGLAAAYFECRETGNEQKRLHSEVKAALTNFSGREASQELTDIVNGYNDNLMERFKADFPGLSASQYRLALYLFCDFSLPSISIFTGTELRNIYVYKSRLKSTISKSDCSRKAEYLEYFR